MANRVVTTRVLDPSTKDWLEMTLHLAKNAAEDIDSDCSRLARYTSALRENRAWERAFDSGERSWDRLCRELIGLEPEFIDAVATGVRALRANGFSGAITKGQALAANPDIAPLAPPGAPEGNRNRSNDAEQNNVDNINVDSFGSAKGGTGAEYLVRRLKRDAPDIADALARGEYPSARSAGIAAGIVRVKPAVERALAIVRRLTREELYDFESKFDELLQQRRSE